MARVGLVDRRRGDRPVRVVRQSRLDLGLRRAVGRERDEEVALPAVRERRRRDIRGDAQDRTPEDRGRDDVAGLARRQRHQAGLGQEGAGPGGPLGVRLEHRLLGRRVALVVLVEDLDVVGVSGGIPGERRHLGVEPVELRLPAGAQRAGVVAQHLALLEDPRVAVLAQLPGPVGSSEEGLEVRDPAVEMRRGRLRRRAQAFLAARVLDIPPDEVADVARGASRRVRAALDDQRVGEVRVEVRDPRVDGPLHLPQARDRRVDQVGLRAQPMEEQREQAAGDGTRVLHAGHASRPRTARGSAARAGPRSRGRGRWRRRS